ncbi:MAG TPA: alpha/beta fold hydrolase [Candidatus Stackebrandtia excrementipullorum]|nr:alpha/beta fold hydrolase [Candidatus Stackebrandtia excrementipullorum]
MHHVTSTDGTPIAVDRTGTGPSLIFVDGALATRETGRALADELVSEYTVYRYDRRGRGDSGDTPPYVVDREIEDLAAVINQCDAPVFVYGYGSGAVLALRAAEARLPVNRMALFEPPFVGSDPDAIPHVSHYLDRGDRSGAIRHFLDSGTVPSDMVNAIVTPDMEHLAHTIVYDHVLLRDNDGLVPIDRLSRIDMPVMLLTSSGSHQALRRAAATAAATLSHGVHREMAGSRHGPPDQDLADLLRQYFVA